MAGRFRGSTLPPYSSHMQEATFSLARGRSAGGQAVVDNGSLRMESTELIDMEVWNWYTAFGDKSRIAIVVGDGEKVSATRQGNGRSQDGNENSFNPH